MFCINCFHPHTKVVNSRGSKKKPAIWRRRRCNHCGITFTTRERPSLEENKIVQKAGKDEPFNLGRLTLSIATAFTHSKEEAKNNSLWLAQGVEDILSSQRETITPEDIEATTHAVLKRYDELAAIQYAAQHKLITSLRKRGRPSLA